MNSETEISAYQWVGSQQHFVAHLHVHTISPVTIGQFGGNSSAGQAKNEDACLVWTDPKGDWEFALLLDAHQTAESAELVISEIGALKHAIQECLLLSERHAFNGVQTLLLDLFESQRFKDKCRSIQGETAVLCVVQKGKFLWWLSIGDCLLYLFHPELSELNEFQQNHRSFYEWVGRANTFELAVPCYSIGVKELRKGRNHIFLTTDGLVECPNTNFTDPREISKAFDGESNEGRVHSLLNEIQQKNVRDSTTILSWFVDVEEDATVPGNL